VTLSGTGLSGATSVTVSGTGVNAITVPSFTVVNDTTITANFTIGATAAITGALATHTVQVNGPGGTSNTVNFTVFGPTVASITPASGARGTTVPVTITGVGLNGATAVTAGGGLTITITSINPAGTSLTANIAVSAAAAVGARPVRVTTPGGVTPINAAVQFTVQ